GVAASVVDVCAFFLSLAFEPSPAAAICVVLWTILALSSLIVLWQLPALIQSKLNKTSEILAKDKAIWREESTVSEQATIMLNKRMHIDTTVSFFKCLKLTPYVANGV
ncbi:hypothetical protein PMAYCL1PPCAC_32761, partial [Pristionchus mayeri]